VTAMRYVIHADSIENVDAGPLLRELAEDVADDARRLAPVDTGDLVSTIRVLGVSKDKATVAVGGKKGASTGNLVDYAVYVERGTSRMHAQPFMAPATYRYRG
jgi:HK97 gp10 family phage protein